MRSFPSSKPTKGRRSRSTKTDATPSASRHPRLHRPSARRRHGAWQPPAPRRTPCRRAWLLRARTQARCHCSRRDRRASSAARSARAPASSVAGTCRRSDRRAADRQYWSSQAATVSSEAAKSNTSAAQPGSGPMLLRVAPHGSPGGMAGDRRPAPAQLLPPPTRREGPRRAAPFPIPRRTWAKPSPCSAPRPPAHSSHNPRAATASPRATARVLPVSEHRLPAVRRAAPALCSYLDGLRFPFRCPRASSSLGFAGPQPPASLSGELCRWLPRTSAGGLKEQGRDGLLDELCDGFPLSY